MRPKIIDQNDSRDTVITNMQMLLKSAKKVDLEVNKEKTKFMITTRTDRN